MNNNQLESLKGINHLTELSNLYVNVNKIDSIKPVKKLKMLDTFYCNYNAIQSLEGIGKKHTSRLKNFVCLPNENLPFKEVRRVEKLGIECKKG